MQSDQVLADRQSDTNTVALALLGSRGSRSFGVLGLLLFSAAVGVCIEAAPGKMIAGVEEYVVAAGAGAVVAAAGVAGGEAGCSTNWPVPATGVTVAICPFGRAIDAS